MNIKINGDVVTITSNIRFEALNSFSPVFIKDEKGTNIYGVNTGAIGSLTEVGATFTYANAAGFAALNVIIPNMDAGDAVEYVLNGMNKELTKLQQFEGAINDAINDMMEAREDLASKIEIG